MTFSVKNSSNAFVDLMPYIVTGGISYKRVYVEGGNSMVMQDGTKFVDRIASKSQWSVVFKPMTAADQATVFSLLDPRVVTLKVTDPETATDRISEYYVSDLPASYLVKRTGGTEWWGGLAATFDER